MGLFKKINREKMGWVLKENRWSKEKVGGLGIEFFNQKFFKVSIF